MSVEENKAVLATVIEEVFNKGNLALIPKLVDHNWKYKTPQQKELRGTEGFKQFVTMYRNAFPDLHMTVNEAIGEGDRIAASLTLQGTFKGKLGELKPTGKQVKMTFAYFYSYKDGKETGEPVEFSDRLTMYEQLGIQL